MKHLTWAERSTYRIAILIRETGFRKSDIEQHYISEFEKQGYSRDDIICFTLAYDSAKSVKAATGKKYLTTLTNALLALEVEHLLVCDTHYFKWLTGAKQAAPYAGHIVPCTFPKLEPLTATICPNWQALFHNPAEVLPKLNTAIKTCVSKFDGTYEEIGLNIIHSEHYPQDVENVKLTLQELHQFPELACDIETYGLNFWETGIATIAFAWNQNEGVAFRVDDDPAKKLALRHFFETYKGQVIFHNANFDLKIIINDLWMSDLLDEVGKQQGINTFYRKVLDTKIMSYVCTNSIAGNKLGLKDQAQEFAGNWAMNNIHDITQIEEAELLRYNLIDALSTFYVMEKHLEEWVSQIREWHFKYQFYKPKVDKPWIGNVLHDSIYVILQMELTGMPLNMDKVRELRASLEAEQARTLSILENFSLVYELEEVLTKRQWEKDYFDRTNKAKNPEKIVKKDWDEYCEKAWVTFNPNSNTQLGVLLYEIMNLPVLEKTDTGLPACGSKVIKKLKNHTIDNEILDFLDALVLFSDAGKILNTFVSAFEGAIQKKDGWHYLHGNFNLGGTVSGRLSSSSPNLQNIPSNTDASSWAKAVKECFEAPPGYLFVGADFASLEDRISALTTKDPNKLKVYTDGYDGHSLRAYSYFKDQMPDIDPTSVDSINSIGKKYKDLRQASKMPTFLLTYGGTWMGMVEQSDMTPEEAKSIEASYHELYAHSDAWVADKIEQATKDGFVEVAFGLRVRTPLLKQVLWNSRHTPYEALKEGRTAGNALGQSYGLLNNRAGIDLQQRAFNSDYRYDIMPVAHIHDAQYFIVKDDIDVVDWMNQNLPDCMAWQDLPEIEHPDVKLGGDLEIFYPNWASGIEIHNSMNQEEILNLCRSTIVEEKVA